MKLLSICLVTVSLAFSSCSVQMPAFDVSEPGVAVPRAWAAEGVAKAGVDHQWIARFRDDRLKALIREGIATNKDLKIAASRVERARTSVTIANSALRPDSSLTLGGQRNKQNFIGFPFGGSTIVESYSLSFEVNWELDLWGRIRTGKLASIAELQAESADYRAARASLVAQIAKAYFNAVEASEQVALAQASLEILGEAASAIQERYESALGDDIATQLRLAQTDIASAKATLAEREGLADQTLRQLEVLLGRYPKGTVSVADDLPKLPSRPPAGLPSELLSRRPDILAAERRYAVAKTRIREAELAKFPSFSLTTSAGTTTESLSDVLDSSLGVWSLGGQIVQPILLNGRVQAEIAARRITQSESLAQLQKTVLNGFSEVEEALASEANLAKRESAVQEALTLAKASSDSAASDYAGGVGDVITLLETRNRYITIASQLSALRRLRLNNRIDLHLALGGDYKSSSK